jgi:hypothetical protein
MNEVRELDVITGELTIRDYTPAEIANCQHRAAQEAIDLANQPISLDQQVADLHAQVQELKAIPTIAAGLSAAVKAS